MENIEEKSHVEDDATSFSHLPDEIVLHILNKVIDFESLCPCKLVSKRFYRITRKVDTISFKTKPSTSVKSFLSAIPSLKKFRKMKSLGIFIPSPPQDRYPVKWKMSCGTKVDSLLFLSPNSVYCNKELYVTENGHGQEEEDMELKEDKYLSAMSSLDHAVMSHVMMLSCIASLPRLEKISLTDSHKMCRISFSGVKIADMRKGIASRYETARRNRVSKCYIPLLELPVSGYVMKGVTLYLMERVDLPEGSDTLKTYDDGGDAIDDKEEAAYNEAVMVIFKKHRARIVRQNDFTSYTFL